MRPKPKQRKKIKKNTKIKKFQNKKILKIIFLLARGLHSFPFILVFPKFNVYAYRFYKVIVEYQVVTCMFTIYDLKVIVE